MLPGTGTLPRSHLLIPTPSPQSSETQRPGWALTGHVEPDGPLCAHTAMEGHPTGEADAVVLRSRGEGDHGGVGRPEIQGGEVDPNPGEGGGCPPLTGPWHCTRNVPGVTRLLLEPFHG